MNEALIKAICQAQARKETVALAAVISTKGSTPRKAGAAMIIWPDGRVFGTIGGGCSEAEVRLKALQTLKEEECCLIEVRMLNDIAAQEGMVCGGIMEVFVQIIKPD